MRHQFLWFVLDVVFWPWSHCKTTQMEHICDAFLAWYAPAGPMMALILIGSCSLQCWLLLVTSLNWVYICCGLCRRCWRRTHPMFFSDVSCASYSRCTLNSSWSLVACTTMSKDQSRSVPSWDFLVHTRPKMHHRCAPFELFCDMTKVEKQLPT